LVKLTLPFLFLLLVSLGLKTWAFDMPQIGGPVVDQAGLLSSNTKNQLSQILFQARENNGPQVQILVVSSLQGLTIEEVAIKVFDEWKLGDKKLNNGVLFLIAPHEKKLRIEVGRGLEGDIPDITAKRIVSDVVRPYFKRGEFNMGVMQGTQAILHYAKAQVAGTEPDLAPQNQNANHTEATPWIFIIIAGLWVVIFIFNPSLALSILFFNGRGGSGGGGGGGWSGGGGSSAGGGASGDW
jgi:uncharacterized protein